MGKVIYFRRRIIPGKPLNVQDPYDDAFDEASKEIEKRYGMSVGQYLKLEGNLSERDRKVQRAKQKEMLQQLTLDSYPEN